MRYRFIVIILHIFLFNTLSGQTIIPGGTIDGDVWIKEKSPYRIAGNVVIANLVIQPAVIVEFIDDFRFEVDGFLQADGFYSDTIFFKPTASNPNGWQGIKFKAGAVASSLSYCRIEGANNQGISIDQSSPEISNCRVVLNNGDGIFIKSTYIDIKHCIINHNDANGIRLDAVQFNATNSIFAGNISRGIYSTDNNDVVTLINAVVANNQLSGVAGSGGALNVTNSIIYDNLFEIFWDQQNTEVSYSDIQGGEVYPGTGNINTFPSFLDISTYTLSALSPCIDTGDTAETDNDRFFPPSQGGNRNDMGAYGGPEAGFWYPPLYTKPQSVEFGRVTKDSERSVGVSILNYRHIGITVPEILFAGKNPEVFSRNRENFFLPVADSLELIVSFTPDSISRFSSDLILQTQFLGDVSVPLTGEGVIAEINVLESELDFKTVSLGDSFTLDVHFLNSGGDTLFANLFLHENDVFTLSKSSLQIMPDLSFDTVKVTFKPYTPLTFQDSLIILSNDPDDPRMAIPLFGGGVGPSINISQNNLDFGLVSVYSDSSQVINISNNGNDILTIEKISVLNQQADSIVFQLSDTTLSGPFTIPPDSGKLLSVQFKPTYVGLVTKQLQIQSSDPFRKEVLIPLSGVGIAPEIVLSDTFLDFGIVPLNADSSQIFYIRNEGQASLLVFKDSLQIKGINANAFVLENVENDIHIAPQDSASIQVRFFSTDPGLNVAQLRICSDDPFRKEVFLGLSGAALAPELTLNNSDINFGQITVFSDSLQVVYIFNSGLGDLIIDKDSVFITGQDSAAFRLGNVVKNIVLSSGDSADLSLSFRPDQIGPAEAVLQIQSNDPINPQQSVMLSGLAFDHQAAAISYDPVNSSIPLIDGQPATLSFIITSVSPVDSAFLFIRQGGKLSYSMLSLGNSVENIWKTLIDSTQISERGLEYYICVYHGWTFTIFPDAGEASPNAITVKVPLMLYPEDTRKEVYQMISVPLSTTGQNLNDLFSDNLGAYNNENYRMFNYSEAQGYTELTSMNDSLIPGKSLWLITKQPKNLDISNGESVPTDRNFALQLKKGWNMIATPFAFPVDWHTVSDTAALRFYDGTDWPFVSVLEPFKGYAVYASRQMTLSIPPKESQSLHQFFKPAYLSGEHEWQIQISAKSAEQKDEFNYVGVLELATPEIDIYDFPEPPVIGNFVSLYILTDGQDDRFSTDYRQTGADGYTFEFEFSSNVSGQKKIWVKPENLPYDFDWMITSNQTQVNYGKAEINISTQQARFQLIVGTPNYLSGIAGTFRPKPLTFILDQNFPNPFNPSTQVKFQLPQTTRVSIDIFDIIGRRVNTLMNNKAVEAGYYQVSWDGTNSSGTLVSSGIYILQLRTAKFNRSIKMIFQK